MGGGEDGLDLLGEAGGRVVFAVVLVVGGELFEYEVLLLVTHFELVELRTEMIIHEVHFVVLAIVAIGIIVLQIDQFFESHMPEINGGIISNFIPFSISFLVGYHLAGDL